jgi:DNA repair protein SbcC/Rad50
VRPLKIELSGFGAFKAPTTVTFADTELFALVGPTGSGKSTVIDAICFALYGTVPRYDDRRVVGAALSLGANEGRVGLEFESGGRTYRVVRVMRRAKTGVSVREARLEEISHDGSAVTLAGKVSELDAEIERILGLTFEHFTRAVVLPQGAFARLLHDKPKDRQELLVTLLELGVYRRVGEAARLREKAHAARVASLEEQLARLAHADDAALARAEAVIDLMTALESTLDGLAGAVDAADEAVRSADAAVAAERTVVAAVDVVQVPADVRRLAAAEEESGQRARSGEGGARRRPRRAGSPALAARALPERSLVAAGIEAHARLAAAAAAANRRTPCTGGGPGHRR